METLKNLADKLLNVFTELVLIENFQRFIAWPNVGGFSKRWQKAHPQEQGHPFSKCYASVAKHTLQLNIARNNIPIFFFNFIFRNG